MAYVPNSEPIFSAAFTGALAGMATSGRAITDAISTDYDGTAAVAGAWAIAIDTAWGVNPATDVDVGVVQQASLESWDRTPQVNAAMQDPLSWATQAVAIVSLVISAQTYYAGQGIVPPGAGGLPAAGDVIVDPLAVPAGSKNLIDRLRRFKVDDPSFVGGVLTWTTNPPGPNKWVDGDYIGTTVGFPGAGGVVDTTKAGPLFVDIPVIGGAKTITLPGAADPIVPIGKTVTICDQHGSLGAANSLQIIGNGRTINGVASITLGGAGATAYSSVTLQFRGAILGWVIIARSIF